MKIKTILSVTNVEDWNELRRFVTQMIDSIIDTVNGKLDFQENIVSSIHSVVFPSANTQIEVSHGLGKIPTGYILVKASAAMSIYDGTSSNTDNKLYIKSTAQGSATVIVI
jgi:predicted RNA-binding protein with EMAP domain